MRKVYLCFKMGSCASIDENPDSSMKLRFSFSSKADKILIPLPTEEKSVNADNRITELGSKSLSSLQSSSFTSFRDFGGKEETFFDTKSWLESDCEDGFFSVNGDFTPSCGSTPNHQNGFIGTPQHNKSLSMDGATSTGTELIATDKKKKLADLFLESFRGDQDTDNQTIAVNRSISDGKLEPKPINLDLPPRSTNRSPYMCGFNSVCSSVRTPNRDFKPDKEKSAGGAPCCLPSFVQRRRLTDGKRRLSPGADEESNKN